MANPPASTDVLIAIIGAGPGGLLLASYLQHNLPPHLLPHLKVFESQPSPSCHHNAQGGSLDLHSDTGLLALRSIPGLYARFLSKTRENGEEMRVVDAKTGEVLLKDGGEWGGRPEIDRGDLREILLESVRERDGTVMYGHHLMSVEPSSSGPASWTLTFRVSNSESTETTTKTIKLTTQILIGADGAWSKTRALLTPARPIYTGLSFIDVLIPASSSHSHSSSNSKSSHSKSNPNPNSSNSDSSTATSTTSDSSTSIDNTRTTDTDALLQKYVGQGMAFILSGSERALIPQRNASGVVRIYAALKVPESWLDEHPLSSSIDERRDQVRGWFESYDDEVEGEGSIEEEGGKNDRGKDERGRGGFAKDVLALLDAADYATAVPRKIYALPPDLTWARPSVPSLSSSSSSSNSASSTSTSTSGGNGNGAGGGIVALLGDAAHVMSPMAGEGVNLALRDALELGKALCAGLSTREYGETSHTTAIFGVIRQLHEFVFTPKPAPTPTTPTGVPPVAGVPILPAHTLTHLSRLLSAYDRLLFLRARHAALESASNLELMFHPLSPHPFVDKMRAMLPPPGGLRGLISLGGLMWVGRMGRMMLLGVWEEGWKWGEREGWW